MLRYQPGGCEGPKTFAALRHRRDGDLFWRYCFVVHDGNRKGTDSKFVFEKHRLKEKSKEERWIAFIAI